MTQLLSGVPKAVASVVDKSLVLNRNTDSKICVKGPTLRGKVDEPVYIRNSSEFIRKLGGRIEDNDFPYHCMRILDAGGKLWVSRTGHYTDNTDKTTLQGTKATARVGDAGAAETLATATATITNAGDDTNVFSISHDGNTIATYGVQTGNAIADIVNALVTSLGQNVLGYTVSSFDTGTGEIIVQAPTGTGATVNTQALTVTVTGAGLGAGTDGTFAGGVDAVEKAIYFVAQEVGTGYNTSTIQVTAPLSGDATKVDILVTAEGSDIVETVTDFPLTPTATDILKANSKLVSAQIDKVVNESFIGSSTLAGGAEDISLIVASDYIGNKAAKTGFWSFGKVVDAMRIANISIPDPDVDVALASYCEDRGDMRFHIATPIGLTPDAAKDYRLGEGIYSHQALDTWRGSLWSGQVNVTDPSDTTYKFDIPALVDFLGRRAVVDSEFGPWISAAGGQRGKVSAPNNGVGDINFLSPENNDSAGDAYTNGVNWIGDDETFGTVVWGNKSLTTSRSTLLNKENVADLAMFIKRSMPTFTKPSLFNPNDPTMWREIYRAVKPFIEKVLVEGRAIIPGENKYWFWQGDQDAKTVADAIYNTQEDLANGIYKARLICVPITATEYIGIEVTITDTGAVASVVEGTIV